MAAPPPQEAGACHAACHAMRAAQGCVRGRARDARDKTMQRRGGRGRRSEERLGVPCMHSRASGKHRVLLSVWQEGNREGGKGGRRE